MWIYWFWTECLTTHRLVALQCYCFEVCMCVCLCGINLLSQGIITWLVSFLLIGRENWKRQEPEFQSSEWKTHGERQRKGVSGTERERERLTKSCSVKEGEHIQDSQERRETYSQIPFSVTARLLGFQWGDSVKPKNMSSSILRRHSSKKGLEKLQRWDVVDLFACVCECVCLWPFGQSLWSTESHWSLCL